MRRVLGIDVGGSGTRAAIRATRGTGAAGPADRMELAGERIGVTAAGSTVPEAVLALVRRAAHERPDEIAGVDGVGVGATGLATLVDDPAALADTIAKEMRTATGRSVGVAVAIDAVTAHLGALNGEPGAIVALGTGAIAFGTDGREIWRRVDGWGHLLGDRGGGAWIGLRGLSAAMRAHDGVDPRGAALLAVARDRFGEPLSWPAQLYTRADRAGVLASFAADVAQVAAGGDSCATEILRQAGEEAARSAAAALDPALRPVISATGGVFRAGGALSDAFARTLAELRPDARVEPPVGDPLDGALILAERAATGTIATHAPYVWTG